ncbi:unnamed protein product [Psylliodes chrysocephalus]|uniref:Transposase n=1 Tax=Psylliodes chrysocephalus TaxID=3402493 RepID=A0A9P0G298_9CUCU|nr:unnamed protein product [Psylliodes chrysocephala]
MFWGVIMLRAKTPLLPLQQTLTVARYVDLVLEPIFRRWTAAIGDNFIFMYDNASTHSSKVARECLETKGVTVLD